MSAPLRVWLIFALVTGMVLEFDGGTIADVAGIASPLAAAAREVYCNLADTNRGWVDENTLRGRAGNLGQALRRSICGRPGGETGPGQQQGFPGGQCPKKYRLTGNVRYQTTSQCGDGPPPTDSGFANFPDMWGPLSGLRLSQPSTSYCSTNETTYLTVQITCFGQGPFPSPTPEVVEAGISSQPILISLLGGWTPTVIDGSPDDCGSLPPPPLFPTPPLSDRSVNVNVTIEQNEGPDIDLTIPFAFVKVDVDADLEPYFDIQLDNDVNVKVPVGIDLNLDFGNGGGSGSPVDGPGENPSEPPEQRQVLCGVWVISTVNSPLPKEIALTGGASYWMPRLGSIAFQYETDGFSVPGPEIEVHKESEFIPVPAGCANAVGWISNPSRDVDWSVSPVYGYSCGDS